MPRLCYKCVKFLPDIMFKGALKACIRCRNNKIHSVVYELLSKASGEVILLKRSYYEIISGKGTRNLNYPDTEKLFNQRTVRPPFIYREDSIVNTIGFWQKYLYDEVKCRDMFICQYCLKYGDTIDHIVPISEGGEDELYNVITSCKECNHLKGTMSYEYFKNNRLNLRKNKFNGENIDKRIRKRQKYLGLAETALSDFHLKNIDWKLKKDSDYIRKQNKKKIKNKSLLKYDE